MPVGPKAMTKSLRDTFCPFRPLKDPHVMGRLITFMRYEKYGVLPDPGGLDDQSEAMMQAFEVLHRASDEVRRGR